MNTREWHQDCLEREFASAKNRGHIDGSLPPLYSEREADPAHGFTILRSALDEMSGAIVRERPAWTSYEVCGYLFSRDDEPWLVRRAPPAMVSHGPDWVRWEPIAFAERRESRLGTRVCGCWHSHPGAADDGLPSFSDLMAWSGFLAQSGNSAWWSVIHVENPYLVAPPAYVTRLSGGAGTRTITRRTTLEVL